MTNNEIATGHFGMLNGRMLGAANFLAAIIASSDDAIISKDIQGVINTWNEGARRIFGYEAEEMVGQTILRLIPKELHHEEYFILGQIRAGERVEHFETIRVRKNAEKFPISVTISPIRDDSGKIIGASKIARDISDRRRADESRSRLAAIVDSADDAIISNGLDGIMEKCKANSASHFSTPPTAGVVRLSTPLRYTNSLAGTKYRAAQTEWVYLGLAIDLLLAFYSQLNGGGSTWDKFDPILVMAFVFASYVLRRCMRANRWSI